MAAGDYDAKVFARSRMPGGGWSTTGVAKQGKTWVCAELTGYYATGGLTVNPQDLGLSTIDFIKADVESINATEPANGEPMEANFLRASNKLMLFVAEDGGTETTNNHAFVVNVFAVGDSATPELL